MTEYSAEEVISRKLKAKGIFWRKSLSANAPVTPTSNLSTLGFKYVGLTPNEDVSWNTEIDQEEQIDHEGLVYALDDLKETTMVNFVIAQLKNADNLKMIYGELAYQEVTGYHEVTTGKSIATDIIEVVIDGIDVRAWFPSFRASNPKGFTLGTAGRPNQAIEGTALVGYTGFSSRTWMEMIPVVVIP